MNLARSRHREDLAFSVYEGTYAELRATLEASGCRHLRDVIRDVGDRRGPEAIAALVALNDVLSGRIKRSKEHLLRRMDELADTAE